MKYEKKSINEWLDEFISNGLIDTVQKELILEYSKEEIDASIPYHRHGKNIIIESFEWYNTPQGYEYWLKLNEQILKYYREVNNRDAVPLN